MRNLSAPDAMLRQSNQIQETGGKHRQTLLRPDAPETDPKSCLYQADHQDPKPDGRAGIGHAGQLYEHAKDQQPGNGPGQQTRHDGRADLQPQKVPELPPKESSGRGGSPSKGAEFGTK